MASKKGISYLWRIFLPYVLSLWVVIIGMAAWQAHRVRSIKVAMVNEQLDFIADRIADLFNTNQDEMHIRTFLNFVNNYYDDNKHYDPISIQVRNPDGSLVLKLGSVIPSDFPLPKGNGVTGYFKFEGKDLEDTSDDRGYVYCSTTAKDGKNICVMLPYTRDIAVAVSPVTTKFWLIFFGIAIFATIFAYIWALFFSQNIRILKNFATRAADSNDTIDPNYDFPHDELGDISRQILTIYNQRIDEMNQREKEHKVALHAIEEKERIKRELTGNINHELKTPVGVIQGYLDTMVSNPEMDAATREMFLLKAADSAHRLSALINDITAITKLESGGKLVNIEEVNFHDLVFTFDNFIREAKVMPSEMNFTYDVPLGCMVHGNEGLLHTVLLNFVKNASKYSKGTLCRLEYSGEDMDFYYFTFYDNGVGVPPECLPHIFERFFRVNAGRSRDSGGTGLGLTIAEVTINSFGGTIEAVNRMPSGLEFHFSLPKSKKINKN